MVALKSTRKPHYAFVHGESADSLAGRKATPEYIAWRSMIQRCERPEYHGFHRYGGRGITVCVAWRHDYLQFLADVGRRPTAGHSLDRYPNADGNYEPGNVRWATGSEQALNKGSR